MGFYIRREVQNQFWITLATTARNYYEKGAFRFSQYGSGVAFNQRYRPNKRLSEHELRRDQEHEIRV